MCQRPPNSRGVWTSGWERNTTSVWSNELLQTEEREREMWSWSCFRSVWPHYLCWWMRKWICKPSLKWCSDTNRSAGNWFTRELQRLKTVSLCSVISFSCLNVWGRRREFFEVFKDMLRRGIVCRSMRSHYYKSTPFKLHTQFFFFLNHKMFKETDSLLKLHNISINQLFWHFILIMESRRNKKYILLAY